MAITKSSQFYSMLQCIYLLIKLYSKLISVYIWKVVLHITIQLHVFLTAICKTATPPTKLVLQFLLVGHVSYAHILCRMLYCELLYRLLTFTGSTIYFIPLRTESYLVSQPKNSHPIILHMCEQS